MHCEAKIACPEVLRYQIVDVHDAFIVVYREESQYHNIAHNCLVSLVIWCDVLFQINVVSKSIQSQNFDVCKSVELSEVCHESGRAPYLGGSERYDCMKK